MNRFIQFTLAAVLCAAAGWMGAWSALREIPVEARRPKSVLPVGSEYTLRAGVAAAEHQRDLRDWLFAQDNGITLQSLWDQGRIIQLTPGTHLVVERGDLEFVRVSTSGTQSLWVRASDIDPDAFTR